MPLPPSARLIPAQRFPADGAAPREEQIAEEVPVALIYNGRSFAVMLATPADLEDFAVGFSLSQRIAKFDDIRDIRVTPVRQGIEVEIDITAERLALLDGRRRNLAGGSGCGLCGADSFTETLRPVGQVRSRQSFDGQAVCRAMAELPAHQVLNAAVGALHAAAFARADGAVVLVREDIGRHNALDKLVGALARGNIDPAAGFVAVSSRCSYEMVHKTAAAGVPLIASVSAPTAMAVELAQQCRVGLLAFARESRFTIYATPSRVRVSS